MRSFKTEGKIENKKENIYALPTDTDNSVMKAELGGDGPRGDGGKRDICNNVNNKKLKVDKQ